MTVETYYYGQGRVSVASRTRNESGQYDIGAWRWVGDVSELTFSMEIEEFTHKESYSGMRRSVRKIRTGVDGALSSVWHQVDGDNLELTLWGKKITTPAGSVTAHELPTLEVGQRYYLPQRKVSALAVDGLTLGTHYSVDAGAGAIDVIALPETGFSQPTTADYEYGAVRRVGIMTAPAPEVALRYDGINLAEGGDPVTVILYRVSTAPLTELALINTGDEFVGMTVAGSVLPDTSIPASDLLGPFGYIES
ncbi:hypothetical protein ACMHYJ_02040 [Castellaniella hirudinis]|uniref:phage tail tube protein n=1 Tax=Castellaniella hirudinis TaxID=1144617 RepID=UPI0039C3DAA0